MPSRFLVYRCRTFELVTLFIVYKNYLLTLDIEEDTMKKLQLILPLLLMAAAVGCSDNDNDRPVVADKVFDTALNAKYPGASNVKWEREGSYMVADFYYQSFDMEAWFAGDGDWRQSETDYGPNIQVLPTEVQTAFAASEYASWSVDDAYRYDRPDMTFYVIDIEKVNSRDLQVFYKPDGTLIQAIPDIADITPDTPIPSV